MLIISPYSRGGYVSPDLFDHTSILRFLESLFGAEVPNLSAWRRATVGDPTSALNFRTPNQSVATPPSIVPVGAEAIQQCAANLAGFKPYNIPNPQVAPVQENGTGRRPSGMC